MRNRTFKFAAAGTLAAAFLLGALVITDPGSGSDHADTPNLTAISRHDVRITDLYAFIDVDSLVVALCVDPTIPPTATEYQFQSDAMYEINIDNSATVGYDDPEANGLYGGTVLDPDKINADVAFRFTFEGGTPRLRVRGVKNGEAVVEYFTGLRDDPFIRGPREGRNVAAIVVKVPLEAVMGTRPELLIWAYSRVPEFDKAQADHGGMALRSMFPENMPMNEMHPRHHAKRTGSAPDVIILNTLAEVGFPNGRALEDDVVDLVGDQRVLGNDFPFPTVNDIPFLSEFPYLSAPHPAP